MAKLKIITGKRKTTVSRAVIRKAVKLVAMERNKPKQNRTRQK